MQLIYTLLDNRLLCRLVFILPIINCVRSITLTFKEKRIIQDTINSNDEFFKALATMNFVPHGRLFDRLRSIMPHENLYSYAERVEIINKTIIKTIMKYVQDENLLGVLTIDCRETRKGLMVTINPRSYVMLVNDLIDLAISLIPLTTITILIRVLFF